MPGKSHGRRSLEGCSPWSRWGLNKTERLHFHFSLSCIGEGNGNPLQCSCLENPRDRGAWWAAVYGVAQSRTRLKRLSSSSTAVLFKAIRFTAKLSRSYRVSVHLLSPHFQHPSPQVTFATIDEPTLTHPIITQSPQFTLELLVLVLTGV